MKKDVYFNILIQRLNLTDRPDLARQLKSNCELHQLQKKDCLIAFQSNNRKIYFIVEGSFVRNLINSKGEEKTIMFHTESFCEFFKSYDTVYFHQKTDYEIKANEDSIVISMDFDYLYNLIQNDLALLQFYTRETEKLLVHIDLFRNFQLSLSSEDYLKWLYENYPFLFLRFASQNIASFMGITHVWLSKLKSKMIF